MHDAMVEKAVADANTAIVLLAGGQARRFPGKLEHRVDGAAMIARVFGSLRETGWPIWIAGKGTFPPQLDASLDAPLIIDRWNGGPLRAFVWACAALGAQRIFAIAADQPALEARVLQKIAASWEPGDEAVVPEHGGEIEPLAALYARRAVLRAAFRLRAGRAAMRDLIASIAARFITLDSRYFLNVNRIEDVPAAASRS
jgi:molybdopterin-guanine dinucleotide biosynthesis protein A